MLIFVCNACEQPRLKVKHAQGHDAEAHRFFAYAYFLKGVLGSESLTRGNFVRESYTALS